MSRIRVPDSTRLARATNTPHAHSELERGLFIVTIPAGFDSPPQDIALAVRPWQAVVEPLDMTLYLDRLLPRGKQRPLIRQATVAVGAEVCGFDLLAARSISAEPLGVVYQPYEWLRSFGAKRGWTNGPVRWEDGTCDLIGSECRPHAAWEALQGDRSAITRRVWRSQIGVLYPFVEEVRVRLVKSLAAFLELPIETSYGIVDDPMDLEVGQLLHHLRGKRIPQSCWNLLNTVTHMRHSLAHLRPIAFDVLARRELHDA
jgi:hypothetical protein